MADLPSTDDDRGDWGGKLNTWLLVGHEADGTHADQLWSGTWDDIRNYDDIADAVTSIGVTETTLLIPDAQDVDENVTVPSTMKLHFVGAGQLTIETGIDLTINSPEHIIAPPRRQIFVIEGTGEVIFSNEGLVYPQWWGALADGSTDDKAEIQAAITSLATPGGVVKILPGTYKIDTVVTLDSNVQIIGVDPETCIFKTKNTGHHGLHAETETNIIIANIGIDGNRSGDTTTVGNIGLFYHDCTHCDIINCRVYDYLGQAIGVGGVSSPGESSYIRVLDCRCYDNNDHAIDFNAVQAGLIRGCFCYNNELSGIFVGHGNTFHVTVTENQCHDNGIDGIILDGSDYASEGAIAILNIITNNICYNNGRHGIHLLGAENNVISNNQCTNNGQVSANSCGIVMADDVESQVCQYNTLIGNVCIDTSGSPTQDYGIWEAGSGNYNMIIGGRCAGNDTAQVAITGASTHTVGVISYDQTGQYGLLIRNGVQTIVATDDVADPPTDTELDTAFGTPAAVGPGFMGIVDDDGAHATEWFCWSDGTAWWYIEGTKAVNP